MLSVLGILFLLLMIVPSEMPVFGHDADSLRINPRGWKRVKPAMQKMTAMLFGCPGLDVGDASVKCEHPFVEKQWGAGIDCSAKVPVNTKAYFQNCPTGYAVVEDYSVIHCKFPGNWDNEVFTCDLIPTTATIPTKPTTKASNATTVTTKPSNATTAVNGTTVVASNVTTTKAATVAGAVTTVAAGNVTTVAAVVTTVAAAVVTTAAAVVTTAAPVTVAPVTTVATAAPVGKRKR